MARSPNYPRLSLREAIEQVRKVYDAEFVYPVDKDAVARALGFKNVNGAALSIINPLRKYGLLQDEGKDEVRVSKDAVEILFPQDDARRAEIVQRLAFTPKPLNDFYETWNGYPPSLEDLRDELEDRGFLERAVDEVMRIYYDNLEFVFEKATEYTSADEQVNEQSSEVEVQSHQSANGSDASRTPESTVSVAKSPEQTPLKELLHVLARGRQVHLYVDGDITQETIDRIIAHLELIKEDLPLEGPREQVGEPLTSEGFVTK